MVVVLEVVRESSRCAIRHDVGHARGPKKAEETSKEPEQPEERELGAGEANSGPITVLRGARGSEERGSNTIAIAAATAMVFHQRFCFSFSPSKVDGYHGLLLVCQSGILFIYILFYTSSAGGILGLMSPKRKIIQSVMCTSPLLDIHRSMHIFVVCTSPLLDIHRSMYNSETFTEIK